ncbi:MAG TPA: zinc ABC transporter substrate-binding protein [Methylomirabilota bacterium]|nr:zinc ABC transporter substrate-binding protein [Methylomirabilota bacterium]
MRNILDRRLVLTGLAATLAFALPIAGSRAAEPLSVVATTPMIADALRVIGGDRVTVTALMGEGVDPHTYRQTRSDIAAMVRADAVFWHGLYLEAQLEDFLITLASRTEVVPIAELAFPTDRLIAHDVYADRYDPHVWMNPRLWTTVVQRIAAELTRIDPAGAEAFETRSAAYVAEIERLADYAEQTLATVPDDARVLVTAHDAFNYFGRAYDFEVMGIQGLSTESEAGLARVEELVGLLVERRIRAIFVETSVSDRNVMALVEGAAARGHEVVVGGRIYSDSMGPPGTYEGTYLGMIDHNVTVIARALGGDAPAAGSAGRLVAAN